MSPPGSNGYRTDLAFIHDVGFGQFADQSAPGLLKLLSQSQSVGACKSEVGGWIDLGCGSGLWCPRWLLPATK